MKTSFIFIVAFFCLSLTYCQIGINTTNPNAILDIQASNQATPSNTDGILIPKVDDFPTNNPTASQDGMMVFVTGSGTPSKGFYFWDNTITSWTRLTGELEKITEIGRVGWRLAGYNPTNYGYIGNNAVDLSISSSTSATNGATGSNSFATGLNSEASGGSAIALGESAKSQATRTTAIGFFALAIGHYSTAIGFGTRSNSLNSMAIGNGAFSSGNYSMSLGRGTNTYVFAETAMGIYNTQTTGSNTTFVSSERLFVIGNGVDNLNTSDALSILKNGTITAPSFDISEITDNKALITKEYAEANFLASSSTIVTAPALLNGYSVYGSGYRDPGYYSRNGRVYLEGLLFKTGAYTGAEVIFNLPIGYRPDARILCQSGQQSNSIRIDILPTGDVIYITGGTQNFVSLEGISFRIN